MLATKSKWLSAFSCIAHWTLAGGTWFNRGTSAGSAAFAIFPDWFWPLIFFIQGLLALAGFWNMIPLRVSFYMGACIMIAWAVATFFGSIIRNQFQPAMVWLLYIGGLKYLIAEYALKLDKVKETLDIITEEVSHGAGKPL